MFAIRTPDVVAVVSHQHIEILGGTMSKDELPPIEFDGKADGYEFFDPRAFWEKVVTKKPDQQPPMPNKESDDKKQDD